MSGGDHYVYIGKKKGTGAIGYVGIGPATRPYGVHSEAANNVLRSGEVWMSTPFSTKDDAERAESLVIRCLTWAAETPAELVNEMKLKGSNHVMPALVTRRGVVRYSALKRAVIVKVTPGHLGERTGPTGEASDVDLTMRCNRWWGFGRAVRRGHRIDYLVAVTAGVKPAPRVVGVWRTKPVSEWWMENQQGYADGEPIRQTGERWNDSLISVDGVFHQGWVATVHDPSPDVRGMRGKVFKWEGYAPQNVGFSDDLRALW